MDTELQRRLNEYRADFETVTGKPFEHFFCPILHTDEDAALCKGHITNDALGSPDIWVPQVEAVDNFFGWSVEADMVAVIQDRGTDLLGVLADPTKNRRHVPRIECDGTPVEYYFPKPSHAQFEGHLYGAIIDSENNVLRNMAMKLPHGVMADVLARDFQVIIEKDYRPQVIASVIKAAHLTLFRMLGYRHVISPTGIYLASILRDFYLKHHGDKKKDLVEATKLYFLKFAPMAMPMAMEDGVLAGTAIDNRVLLCIGGSQRIFAMCVIVQAANDKFGVFVPVDDESINTYFSFLNEPNESVLVRFAQFFSSYQNSGESKWEVYMKPERRILMPHTNKTPQWAVDKYTWGQGP